MGDAFWDSMRCPKCYRKCVDLCSVCDKDLIEKQKQDLKKKKKKELEKQKRTKTKSTKKKKRVQK